MELAKSGEIQNVCQPNALLTLEEYLLDHGDEETTRLGRELIAKEIELIPSPEIKKMTKERLEDLKQGKRDLYF